MKKRNLNRGVFRFERFEDRRMLAADFAAAMVTCDALPVEQCEVVSIEDTANETLAELDLDSTEVGCDLPDSEPAPSTESPVDQAIDVSESETPDPELETPTTDPDQTVADDELDSTQTPAVDAHDLDAHDLGDPVDGTDGFFGALDQENSSQSFTLTPSEDGMVEVVISDSLVDTQAELEVTDADGNVLNNVSIEDSGEFQRFSFEANANETFTLTVSAPDGETGQFQLTSSHSEILAPTDLHANEIGEDSTELNFAEGASELTGELEIVGDVDTFRFSADGTGKATLGLAELTPDNATELQVEVFDAAGESIARGITNENVGISFNTEVDGEYFIAVSAGPDQVGSYGMNLTVATAAVEQVVVVDKHVDEMGGDATELTFEENVAVVSGELEVGEDRDAFQFVAPGDGEVTVAMTATSDGYSTEASVTAYDDAGLPIVAGTTNNDVGIRFDVNADQSVQLMVDSLNDVPAAYELVATFWAASDPAIDSIAPTDDLAAPVIDTEDGILAGEIDNPLVVNDEADAAMETCFNGDEADDASDEVTDMDLVDAAFSSLETEGLFSEPSSLS